MRRATIPLVLTGLVALVGAAIVLDGRHRDRGAGPEPRAVAPPPGNQDRMSNDGGEVLPGLLLPEIYGVKDWPALHGRVTRNLVSTLLDLTRVAHEQGNDARADVLSSLALAHALYSRGDNLRSALPLPVGAATDEEGLESSVVREVRRSRLYPSSFVYLSLHPSAVRLLLEGEPPRVHPTRPDAELVWGMLWLLAARADDRDGDRERARAHAARSVDLLCGALEDGLAAWGSTMDVFETRTSVVFLGYRLGTRTFPWGFLASGYQLEQILLYAEEAASLGGDPLSIARVESLRTDVQVVLRSEPTGILGGWPRTSGVALNRVPT